jgi:hypothetical protein
MAEIVAHYPQLTPAEVHAALAYDDDHRDALQQDMRDAETLVAVLKAHIPSQLRLKRSARAAGIDPLPRGWLYGNDPL